MDSVEYVEVEGMRLCNRLYTVSELAPILRLNVKTVYRLCRAERIPHKRIEGSIRFTPEQVRNLLEAAHVGEPKANEQESGE